MESPEAYWRFFDGPATWIFGTVCVAIALVLLRLVLRERLTLQGSMSSLAFLVLLGGMALFPDLTGQVAYGLGFSSLAKSRSTPCAWHSRGDRRTALVDARRVS